MSQEERGLSRGEQPLPNDQGVKVVGECPCYVSGLLPLVKNTLTTLMGLLDQDQVPLLARNLTDKIPTLLQAGY